MKSLFHIPVGLYHLIHWRNSLWKYLLTELAILFVFYYAVALLFYFYISRNKEIMELYIAFTLDVQSLTKNIPTSFMVGSTLAITLHRWWSFCAAFPSLTPIALTVEAMIQCTNPEMFSKKDTRGLVWDLRHGLCRYISLACVFCLRQNSYLGKKRFTCKGKNNKVRHIINHINKDRVIMETFGCLVTQEELELLENLELSVGTEDALDYWLPIKWAMKLCERAIHLNCLKEGNFWTLVEAINKVRLSLENISKMGLYRLPLIYSQSLMLLLYWFFFSILVSHDYMRNNKGPPWIPTKWEVFLPWVAFTRLLYYVSWYKISLSLVNPLREDQSEFPTNEILDRNLLNMYKFSMVQDRAINTSVLDFKPDAFYHLMKHSFKSPIMKKNT
ncbi:hypothetical protein Ciccas_006104 [Cichlidogyrus casuarinus]|uniref:Bestrophin homolog n=1 Tax=Cichlidogyrus casuarinus TaxID=1844966 RepID=A0ABD2Q7A2_9PLAT